jgi:hypothetical protein
MNKKPIDINYLFSALFFELFQSEIIIELPEQLKDNKAIFLADKNDFMEQLHYAVPIIFKGFGQKLKLIEAIDETEFHLAILSFFKRYGNIYRKTEYLDDKYMESLSIAFFNPFIKEIQVITKQVSETFTGDNEKDFTHLNWLFVTKQIVFELLLSLKEKGLDSYSIKTNYHQYIETQNREKLLIENTDNGEN